LPHLLALDGRRTFSLLFIPFTTETRSEDYWKSTRPNKAFVEKVSAATTGSRARDTFYNRFHPGAQITDRSKNPSSKTSVLVYPGMPIVECAEATTGKLVGATEAYCIYRLDETDTHVVSHWREVAVAGITPVFAPPPATLAGIDRQNARAVVLRELLFLEPFGLSTAESAVLRDLLAQLTLRPPAASESS
jgi:hypothetical protein